MPALTSRLTAIKSGLPNEFGAPHAGASAWNRVRAEVRARRRRQTTCSRPTSTPSPRPGAIDARRAGRGLGRRKGHRKDILVAIYGGALRTRQGAGQVGLHARPDDARLRRVGQFQRRPAASASRGPRRTRAGPGLCSLAFAVVRRRVRRQRRVRRADVRGQGLVRRERQPLW